ncbi:MAG: phosphoribosyltransferase family protein [Actinomycetaceae bacterium]|nr:phosphoribosyltransferase family protein [Actinomycetaceae bacterium]
MAFADNRHQIRLLSPLTANVLHIDYPQRIRAPLRHHQAGEILRAMWEELLNLILPTSCVGCGRWDTPLCNQCFALADNRLAVRVKRGTHPDLRAYSLGTYEGALRRIIVAIKHNSALNLTPWLYHAGRCLASAFASHESVRITPVPSGIKRRWKGMLVTPTIAQGVADSFNTRGVDAQICSTLRMPLNARSQAGLTRYERERRRHVLQAVPTTGSHIIVDDVMTTGTTIRSAAYAVEEAGGEVLGVVTLANVPTPHRSR